MSFESSALAIISSATRDFSHRARSQLIKSRSQTIFFPYCPLNFLEFCHAEFGNETRAEEPGNEELLINRVPYSKFVVLYTAPAANLV